LDTIYQVSCYSEHNKKYQESQWIKAIEAF
jgi:hypothetical protein